MIRRYGVALAIGALLIGVLLIGVLLIGSLVGGGAPPEAERPYQSGDVMFLQMMTPHHRQGLTIVRLAADRPVRDEVRQLADAIAATQTDEIKTMSGWLREWRQPATAPADAHTAHGGMPGTTAAEITAVAKAPDAEFEAAFLKLLIAHQDDAIQIARLELRTGGNADVVAFARRIEQSRTAQIKLMRTWLDQLHSGS